MMRLIVASNGNESPTYWDKISTYDRDAYYWSGAQFIGTDSQGAEYFVVEGDSDSRYFNFYLVYVEPDGNVGECSQRRVDKDSYTTDKADEAMEALRYDFYDYYNI